MTFALLDKRKNFYNGVMTYKQGFITGLIITAIVTIFSPLTQWIISNVITPDYFKNVIQYSVETGYGCIPNFFHLPSLILNENQRYPYNRAFVWGGIFTPTYSIFFQIQDYYYTLFVSLNQRV
jgi:hypothetical protein